MRRITTRSACSGQVQGAASCCCAVSSSRLAIVVHRSSSLVRGSDRGWSIYRHGRVAATMESHRPERHEEIWRRRECGEPMSVTVERTSLAWANVCRGPLSMLKCCRVIWRNRLCGYHPVSPSLCLFSPYTYQLYTVSQVPPYGSAEAHTLTIRAQVFRCYHLPLSDYLLITNHHLQLTTVY